MSRFEGDDEAVDKSQMIGSDGKIYEDAPIEETKAQKCINSIQISE
jgi:hypothetical protein